MALNGGHEENQESTSFTIFGPVRLFDDSARQEKFTMIFCHCHYLPSRFPRFIFFMCMYVCMYAWMYVCMYVSTFVWMYLCMFVYLNVCVPISLSI